MSNELKMEINFNNDELSKICKSLDELNENLRLASEGIKGIDDTFSNTVGTISIVVESMSVLCTAIDIKLIPSLSALNVAIIGSGIGAFTVLIGTLATALMSSIGETQKQKTKIDELSESVEALSDDYGNLKQKQQEALKETSIHSDYISDLWKELQTLSEKRNKSNDDMDRAKWIAKELNEELGTNIQLTKDGSLANTDQIASIDKLIEKKRALSALEALEPGYKDAIIEKGKAEAEMRDILTQKIQKQAEIEAIRDNVSYDDNKKTYLVLKKMEEMKELDKLYAQAEECYKGHLDTMNGYEALCVEAMNGNYEGMNQIISDMGSNLLTSSTSTTDQPKEQFDKIVLGTKEAIASGSEFNETQQALLKENLQKSAQELMQSMEESGTLSEEKRSEIAGEALLQIVSLGDMTKAEFESICTQLGISTQEGLELIGATINKEGNINTSKLKESGVNGALGFESGYVSTTDGSLGNIAQATQQIAQTAKDTLGEASPSKVFKEIGRNVVEGLNLGILNSQATTTSTVSSWGNSISNIFGKTKMPGVDVSVSYTTPKNSVLASAIKFLNIPGFPNIKFSKRALGGLVEPGELFLAREAGPELVGSLGSQTAVMNNNQIVEAVSNGVYKAVTKTLQKNKLSLEQLKILTALKRAY